MSWTIDRRGVAVVTMNTNPVNVENRAFFTDLHDAVDRLDMGQHHQRLGVDLGNVWRCGSW
jgi:hypothetical protein